MLQEAPTKQQGTAPVRTFARLRRDLRAGEARLGTATSTTSSSESSSSTTICRARVKRNGCRCAATLSSKYCSSCHGFKPSRI